MRRAPSRCAVEGPVRCDARATERTAGFHRRAESYADGAHYQPAPFGDGWSRPTSSGTSGAWPTAACPSSSTRHRSRRRAERDRTGHGPAVHDGRAGLRGVRDRTGHGPARDTRPELGRLGVGTDGSTGARARGSRTRRSGPGRRRRVARAGLASVAERARPDLTGPELADDPQSPAAPPVSAIPTSATPTSAIPTSATPTSAIPTSATPSSAIPTSATPTSAIPTSATPTSAARPAPHPPARSQPAPHPPAQARPAPHPPARSQPASHPPARSRPAAPR